MAFRRSDLIESIHDGTYFNDHFKRWVFLPAGVVLAMLVITGLYLFLLPYIAQRKRVRKQRSEKIMDQTIPRNSK